MTAKAAAERKREERERKKLKEEERLARLLAYRLKIDIYHGTVEKPANSGADRLSDEA
ncbi:hypothetical protein ACE0DR_05715 [Azotobacter sp. CWF10]